MKIVLAQLNYKIGDFEGNKNKIIEAIQNAKNQDTDLIVFSELSVCGYIPMDMLEYSHFIELCEKTLNQIVAKTENITVIIGSIAKNQNSKGKTIYNSAFVIQNCKIIAQINKTLLPTYDVFDEYRYFEPNSEFQLVKIKNLNCGITICEDLWDEINSPLSQRNALYKTSPIKELKNLNPNLIINIAASPFSYSHDSTRKKLLSAKAIEAKCPIVYVNQIGAHAGFLFDGGSMIVNSDGEILKQASFFKEENLNIDTDNLVQNKLQSSSKIEKIHDALIFGVKEYFVKMGFKKAVLGLSGGIDSALTMAIAQKALGSSNITAILLPSKFSSDHSVNDSVEMCKKLDIKYHIVSIEPTVEAVKQSMKSIFDGLPEDLTEENIQARARAIILMAYSNKFGHILLNTSNKSESAVGYGTLYGDMCGGISVIGDLYKTEVYQLSKYFNKETEIIPNNIITKAPSAELRENQKDSDSLPEYDILDAILYSFIEERLSSQAIIEKGFKAEIVQKVIKLVNQNEYKRFQSPPVLRVSERAFGIGRRMPLVASFQV